MRRLSMLLVLAAVLLCTPSPRVIAQGEDLLDADTLIAPNDVGTGFDYDVSQPRRAEGLSSVEYVPVSQNIVQQTGIVRVQFATMSSDVAGSTDASKLAQ